MAESIPLINAVIWTWSRLAAAPGEFAITENNRVVERPDMEIVLRRLFRRINRANFLGEAAKSKVTLFI